jgi:hypothetical protein
MAEPASSPGLFARWLRAALGLGLVAGGVAVAFLLWQGGHPFDALAHQVPDDASSALFVRGLDRWADALSQVSQSTSDLSTVRAIRDAQVQGKAALGLDIYSVRDWNAAGVDASGTFAAVSLGDKPETALLLLYVPVDSEAKALALLQRAVRDQHGRLTEKADSGTTIWAASWDTAQRPFQAAAFHAGYLILCQAGAARADAVGTLRAIAFHGKTVGLGDLQGFAEAARSVDSGWVALAYSSPLLVTQLQKASGLAASPMLGGMGTRGAVGALLGSPEKLSLQLRLLNDPAVSVLPGLGRANDLSSDVLPGPVLAVARVSFDLPVLRALVRKDPSLEMKWTQLGLRLRRDFGLDLDADLVENTDGQLTLALLKPLPGAKDPAPEGLLSLGVKDAARASATLDHVQAAVNNGMPIALFQFDGPTELRWAQSPLASGGLAGKELLVVSASRGESMHQALTTHAPGYGQTLPAGVAAALQHGAPVFVHVQLDALAGLLMSPEQAERSKGAAAQLTVEPRPGQLRLDLDLFAGKGGFTGAVGAPQPDAGRP